MRDALVEPAARGLQLSLQEGDGAALRRERGRSLDRRRGGIELAEPEVGQAEVGPCRRLRRDQIGGARKRLQRLIEQPDMKRGQTTIETARGLFVNR